MNQPEIDDLKKLLKDALPPPRDRNLLATSGLPCFAASINLPSMCPGGIGPSSRPPLPCFSFFRE